MSFLVYEEDRRKCRNLVQILERLFWEMPEAPEIYCVENQEEALGILEKTSIDAAFISWEDTWGRGFFLSENLLRKERHLNIIAMAETYKYMQEFWKWHMSGYIVGELTREEVLEELDHLRYKPYQMEKQITYEKEMAERKHI